MTMNRREFVAASVASAAMMQEEILAQAVKAGDVQVTVDATVVSEAITPLVFGGYMEPATTGVWAEMLTDRKFARSVTDAEPPPSRSFMRRYQRQFWKPVGPGKNMEMDKIKPFVGQHSPRIGLDPIEVHGIQQGGLRLGRGKSYVGRVYLAGDPGAKIMVRLVWGPGASDSQTIPIPLLSHEYRKVPLKFTSPVETQDARLEIVGTGSGSFHIGTVSLMPADNVQGFHAGMIKYFKDAGFAMAKWPGGNFVSAYDWHDGLGDPDKRPPRISPVWSNLIESNDVGIHEFVGFCRLLGAEPYITVNSGLGEARIAAEEVEYANGSIDTPMGKLRAASGHPEPFNIRLWCIGNEMYGFWQFGHMSLNQYCVKHNYFVEAMKKVDPTIKVTSAGSTPCEISMMTQENKQFLPNMWWPPFPNDLPYKFGGTNDWDGWMLAKCADNIDHISEHTYCYPELSFDTEKQLFVDRHDPLYVQARRLPNRMGEAFESWQKYVEKMPWLKERNLKFIFDEWGVRFPNAAGTGMTRRTGMVTPLSFALFLHEMFRHSDMVAASCPTSAFSQIVPDRTGDAAGFTVEGLVIKLMRTHFAGAHPLEVDGNSPQQPVSGTPFLDMPTKPTGSPTYPLDVVAALSGDRKRLILSVVNPTVDGREFTLQINGVKLRGMGKLWQLAAPSVDAENVPGKEPAVRIVESSQTLLLGKTPVPPISVNVYEFDVENGRMS